jgi:hypothetical protein
VAGLDWFHMASGFAEHPKVLALSDRDFRAFVRMLCWTAHAGTDGRFELAILGSLGVVGRSRDGRAMAERMVRARLWEWSGDGRTELIVHDWLDYNPKAETLKAKRNATAARVRKHRAKGSDVTRDVTHDVTRYDPPPVTRLKRVQSKRESPKDSPPLDPPPTGESAAPPPEPSPGAQATALGVEDNGTGPPLKENGRVDLEAIAADAPPAIAAAIERARARVLVTDDEGNA